MKLTDVLTKLKTGLSDFFWKHPILATYLAGVLTGLFIAFIF